MGWWDEPPDGGDCDVLLWLLLPGYMLLDEPGRRARWPLLYAAKDQRRKALKAGAIPDDSEIGHQLTDDWCQYGVGHQGGGKPRCGKCYPWAAGTRN